MADTDVPVLPALALPPGASSYERHENEGRRRAVPAAEIEVYCVVRVAALLKQLLRLPGGAGCWSARIPLDRELLPATVLRLGVSPAYVTLDFEVGDWDAREFLRAHLPLLEALVREALIPGSDLAISV